MTGFTNTPGHIYGSTIKEVVAQILDLPLPTWNGTHTVVKVCNLGCEHEVQEEMDFPELIVFKDFTDWNVGYGDSGDWPLAWVPQSAEVAGHYVCDWTSPEAEALMHLLKVRWDRLRAEAEVLPPVGSVPYGYMKSKYGLELEVVPEGVDKVRFIELGPSRDSWTSSVRQYKLDVEAGYFADNPGTDADVLGEYRVSCDADRLRTVIRLDDESPETHCWVAFPDEGGSSPCKYTIAEVRDYRLRGEWVRTGY